MEDFYLQAIAGAKSFIEARDTETLLTEEFSNEIHSRTILIAPTIDKDNIDVRIDNEVTNFNNVPPGISFTPGEKMDYASFGIPIIGNKYIFIERFKYMIQNNPHIYRIVDDIFYIREYSESSLINNDPAIGAVKSSAIQKVNNIISSLKELEKDINIFNQDKLSEAIKNMVKAEVEKRKQKDDAIQKLKLF